MPHATERRQKERRGGRGGRGGPQTSRQWKRTKLQQSREEDKAELCVEQPAPSRALLGLWGEEGERERERERGMNRNLKVVTFSPLFFSLFPLFFIDRNAGSL
jgi:hypothetical protein